MINNRQGGRRRGRGGQRGPNVSGGGQTGNRQDNRQRGNAAQLLEKYKSMARDAQLAGDRVQTEYYLQYADHYFRVLGENQPRFSEQRPRRDDMDDDDGDDDQLEAGDSDNDDDDRGQREDRDRSQREERPQRGDRPQRDDRQPRDDQPQRDDRPQLEDRPQRAERAERAERRPARERTPRNLASDAADGGDRNVSDRGNGGGETIPFDVLPPAIGLDAAGNDEAPEEKAPVRRRTRAPRRPDGDSDVAPAA